LVRNVREIDAEFTGIIPVDLKSTGVRPRSHFTSSSLSASIKSTSNVELLGLRIRIRVTLILEKARSLTDEQTGEHYIERCHTLPLQSIAGRSGRARTAWRRRHPCRIVAHG
jgi:hypothetical protein